MEFSKAKLLTNPVSRASLISRCVFLWIVPLIRKGFNQGLRSDDLYEPREEDRSKGLGDRVEAIWLEDVSAYENQKCMKPRPRLWKALVQVFGRQFLKCVSICAMYSLIVQVFLPISLLMLLESLEKNDGSVSIALSAASVCLLSFCNACLTQFYYHQVRLLGGKCRIACCALIYRKTLRLSQSSLAKVTLGQITNLMSADVKKFDENFDSIAYIFFGPFQLITFSYFLWHTLGPPGFIGPGITLLMMPLEYCVAKRAAKYRKIFSEKTDARGSLMSEVIRGIRMIKMYAFETPFSKMIDHIRKLELKELKRREILLGINVTLTQISARLLAYAMFLVYVLHGGQLTSMTVFFTLAALSIIVRNTIDYASKGLMGVADIRLGLVRIETFLQLEEYQVKGDFPRDAEDGKAFQPRILLKNVCASWTTEATALDGLTVTLEGPKLVFVVGPVGCGKSSLLNALIEELATSSENMTISGSLSYASQEPWIFAGTLRQNILFGQPMDPSRYKETIRMASMEQDILQLPQGDLSMVGERGVILSGGQKARVNLARAIYRKADIYLLDDPLSAVDPKVSKELFNNCVRGHLSGSMRILVTHQVQYLPAADHIIVLDQGKILTQGTYDEILNLGLDLEGLLKAATNDTMVKGCSPAEEVFEETPKTYEPTCSQTKQDIEPIREGIAVGSVNYKTYWNYFKTSRSPIGLLITASCFLLAQLSLSGSDYWLSFWTKAEDRLSKSLETICVDDDNSLCNNDEFDISWSYFYLDVYTSLLAIASLACFARIFSYFRVSSRISSNLHNSMFTSVVRAPVKFFDDNPSGRIINRFVNDLGSIDETLPLLVSSSLIDVLNLAGALILVIFANFYMAFPTTIVLLAFCKMLLYFLPSARDIKRIEAVARSPTFSHVAASLQGMSTLRSAKVQDVLIKEFDHLQDVHTGAWYLYSCICRWLGVWIEMISTVYLTIIAFALLYIVDERNGSNVGLAIYSILTLTVQLQWTIRQCAETENQMTSVERTLEYVTLVPEAPLGSSKDSKLPEDWPKNGEISFQNVNLFYNNAHPVLNNLTFEIRSGEKIGIVGRTGAGKSSIVSCLFRLVEPTGDIYIDGVRVNQIGLHDLRKNLSIIPQDPFLFAGTLRYNLDPFGQFGDHELLRSLEDVQLKDAFPQLEFLVSDGGTNFSVGQRQLVCLARAILRNNKIIVMDEATANVDLRTDGLIQSTIKLKFAHCTVITIAHRLNTVVHADRILVLDHGQIKEYDRPEILLQHPEGWFRKNILESGPTTEM